MADETLEGVDDATTTETVETSQVEGGEGATEESEGDTPPAEKTALEGGGEAEKTAPTWPDDWRTQAASGDEKLAKRLERYKSPQDVAKALAEAQDKLRSNQTAERPGEDASEADIEAYRKAHGIPDKPAGYLDKVKGVVVGEDDQALVDAFLEDAHAQHTDPHFVEAALQWWQGTQDKAVAAQKTADDERRSKTVEDLRAEWGNEYRPNVQSALNWLETAPKDDNGTPLKELLLNARLGDGSLLGDNATALRWLTGLAKEANPAGFLTPADGMSNLETVDAEIEKIRKVMREDRKAYDSDQAMQDRFKKLLDAKEKLAA